MSLQAIGTQPKTHKGSEETAHYLSGAKLHPLRSAAMSEDHRLSDDQLLKKAACIEVEARDRLLAGDLHTAKYLQQKANELIHSLTHKT